MMDDFDFEDDLESLKDEGDNNNENSFFPPVNNNVPRSNMGSNLGRNKSSALQKSNDKYSIKGNNETTTFPEPISANAKYGNPFAEKSPSRLKNGGFGDDDDFGLNEIKPKGQNRNDSFNHSPSPQKMDNIGAASIGQKKKVDDYVDDFGDFDDFDEPPKPATKEETVDKSNSNLEPNPFPSPGFSKDIDEKLRGKPKGGFDLQGMRRLNSKLDKSSDFDDYNDDLSNLNKPASPSENSPHRTNKPVKPNIPKPVIERKKEAPILEEDTYGSDEFESKPYQEVPNIKKIPSPRSKEVIASKDKPVTMRTGPTIDPEPAKQNLRLDTEQKNRIGKKKPQETQNEYEDSSEQEDGGSFITQPKKQTPIVKKDSLPDTDQEPKKMKKADMRSLPEYDDEDCDALHQENDALIHQLLEFTTQMDSRMVLLKKSRKVDKQLEDRPSSAINSRKRKLDAMTRKRKLLKADIESMRKGLGALDDTCVEKENEFKNQERILADQNLKLKDYRKVIREQKKFLREIEQYENTLDTRDNLGEMKDKFRKLKKEFTEEDKRLRDQHQEVQTMKERNRKIKEYVTEK